MRSLIKTILIAGCLVLMGYMFYIYYIDPNPTPVVKEAFAYQGQAAVFASPVPQDNSIAPFFTPEVQFWKGSIANWSATYGIDKNLIATVMQIESCGNPQAVSGAGAMGLFQVMPFHFNASENPYDPETNAHRGMNYLSRSLEAAGGDARLALAGYNGGIGVISRGEWTWSAQTQRYVQFGYPIYADAVSGQTSSTTLTDWFNQYGAGLCRNAALQLGIN